MTETFAVLGLGGPELLIIGILLLMMFGFKKIPKMSHDIGTSLKEVKAEISEVKAIKDEVTGQVKETSQALHQDLLKPGGRDDLS